MADIIIPNEQEKMLFEEKLFRAAEKEAYFTRFKGGSDSIMHVKTDLEKGQGLTEKFGIKLPLVGEGVKGNEVLEGNEEEIEVVMDQVVLEMHRHAVTCGTKKDRKQAFFKITEEQRDSIKTWGAEKQDKLCFDELLRDPNFVIYPNSTGQLVTTENLSTAVSGIHATNSKPTGKFIRFLKNLAKSGCNDHTWKLKPVKIDGKSYFVILAHDDFAETALSDSEIYNVHKDALERGKNNPLFTDASVIYRNIIIHTHENMPIAKNSSGTPYARAKILGQQALIWAWGMRPELISETKDYKFKLGMAYDMMAGVKRPQFALTNSKVTKKTRDFGSIDLVMAIENISNI
jgi:N4-gp56 family major capsid protein